MRGYEHADLVAERWERFDLEHHERERREDRIADYTAALVLPLERPNARDAARPAEARPAA